MKRLKEAIESVKTEAQKFDRALFKKTVARDFKDDGRVLKALTNAMEAMFLGKKPDAPAILKALEFYMSVFGPDEG